MFTPLDLRVRLADDVPSSSPLLEGGGFNLVCLELLNSTFAHEVGIYLGSVWEGLTVFPEPCETLPSWPAQDNEIECDQRHTEESKTPEALHRTHEGGTPVRAPAVFVHTVLLV